MAGTATLIEGKGSLALGAGNWSGGSGTGGDPDTDDNIFITSGSQVISGGLNALAGISVARVFISRGFKGTIGSSGSSMEFSTITNGLEVYGGGGHHYFKFNNDVAKVRVAGSDGGKVWLSGTGNTTKFVLMGGECECADGLPFTEMIANRGTLTVRGNTQRIDYIRAISAVVNLYASLGYELNIGGPRAKVNVFDLPGASPAIPLLRMTSGYCGVSSPGTITKLEGLGGTLSTAGATSVITVTDADLHKDFVIQDGTDLRYLTFTNAPQLYGYAGGGIFG